MFCQDWISLLGIGMENEGKSSWMVCYRSGDGTQGLDLEKKRVKIWRLTSLFAFLTGVAWVFSRNTCGSWGYFSSQVAQEFLTSWVLFLLRIFSSSHLPWLEKLFRRSCLLLQGLESLKIRLLSPPINRKFHFDVFLLNNFRSNFEYCF